MKYYKVVRKEKRGLFSALVPRVNRFRRRYEKDEWAEARKGSLLFVFSTRDRARSFKRWQGGMLSIWECQIQGKSAIDQAITPVQSFKIYKDFWGLILSGGQAFHSFRPSGTVGAKRVKLIKEIS